MVKLLKQLDKGDFINLKINPTLLMYFSHVTFTVMMHQVMTMITFYVWSLIFLYNDELVCIIVYLKEQLLRCWVSFSGGQILMHQYSDNILQIAPSRNHILKLDQYSW